MTTANILYRLHTLFLFTKADMKCAMLSIVVFAILTTQTTLPSSSTSLHTSSFLSELQRFIRTTAWVWLHLLHHTIANQCTNPSEDALNKPHRPIPSGRISLRNAQRLRWVLAPVCLLYSDILYGREVATITTSIILLVMMYNDLGGDAHWVLRDCVNAGLFATFASGASIVSNNSGTLSSNSVKAIIINTLLYATTNYSQDFKDVIGDARVGRRTVPIAFPAIARVLLMPLLICWSIGLALVWQLGLSLSVPFIAYATAIGCRYLVCKGEAQDKKSAQLFVGWLAIAHLLPAYRCFSNMGFSVLA